MRVVADENVFGSVIAALRNGGHDVLSIRETMPGTVDEKVLALALAEGRLLLTNDKNFAAKAARLPKGELKGLMLLRLPGESRTVTVQRMNRDRFTRRLARLLFDLVAWKDPHAQTVNSLVR